MGSMGAPPPAATTTIQLIIKIRYNLFALSFLFMNEQAGRRACRPGRSRSRLYPQHFSLIMFDCFHCSRTFRSAIAIAVGKRRDWAHRGAYWIRTGAQTIEFGIVGSCVTIVVFSSAPWVWVPVSAFAFFVFTFFRVLTSGSASLSLVGVGVCLNYMLLKNV